MENECEALPGVAYPRVRDNRSTINTKTGYDDDDDYYHYNNNLEIMSHLSMLAKALAATVSGWRISRRKLG